MKTEGRREEQIERERVENRVRKSPHTYSMTVTSMVRFCTVLQSSEVESISTIEIPFFLPLMDWARW